MRPKRLAVLLLVALFVYTSLYTWNRRTGHLDALSSHTGLELAGWVLRPGKWVADKVSDFWEDYIFLVGLKRENERLKEDIHQLVLENGILRERAQNTRRLERLLSFGPPPGWAAAGSRVLAHRLGPADALETVLIDKGEFMGVDQDTPVVTHNGVVGHIYRVGPTVSTVLLIHDPNSRIPVVGQDSRTMGVAFGRGPGKGLAVRYMDGNAELAEGELLVTSGLSGIFPKGLPVGVVTKVERSELSLFLAVEAEPLEDIESLEEVLLLKRTLLTGAED